MRVVLNGSEGRMGLTIKKICIEKNIEILGVDLKKNDGVYNSFDEINVDFDGIIDFSSPLGMIKAVEFAVKKKKPMVMIIFKKSL
jgi:dihydrodipicolinate reductase